MMVRFDRLNVGHRAALAAAIFLPVLLAAVSVAALIGGVEATDTLRRAERADADGAPKRLNAARQVWLRAGTRGLAAAELERRTGDSLLANRLAQSSMEVVPMPGRAGGIALDVSATGNLAGLRRALFELETGRPVIFVRQLEIRRGGEAVGPGTPAPLEIRMRLEAFAQLGSPS